MAGLSRREFLFLGAAAGAGIGTGVIIPLTRLVNDRVARLDVRGSLRRRMKRIQKRRHRARDHEISGPHRASLAT